MRCLSTRRTSDGLRRRRYEQPDGTRFSTVEVPATVWNALNQQGRFSDRMAQFQRVVQRNSLRGRALVLLHSGWKPLAVAHDISVPVRTVQRWKLDSQKQARNASEKKLHKAVDSLLHNADNS